MSPRKNAPGSSGTFADLPEQIQAQIIDLAIPQLDALHLLANVVQASAPLLLVSRASYVTVTRVWKRMLNPSAGSSSAEEEAKKEPSLPEDMDEAGLDDASQVLMQQWCSEAGRSMEGCKEHLQRRLKAALRAQQGGNAGAGAEGEGIAAAPRQPLPPVPPCIKGLVAEERRARICLASAKEKWRLIDSDLSLLPYHIESLGPYHIQGTCLYTSIQHTSSIKLHNLVDVVAAACKRWEGDCGRFLDPKCCVVRTEAQAQAERQANVTAWLRRKGLAADENDLERFESYISSGTGNAADLVMGLVHQRRGERQEQMQQKLTARGLSHIKDIMTHPCVRAFITNGQSSASELAGLYADQAAVLQQRLKSAQAALAAAQQPAWAAFADTTLRRWWEEGRGCSDALQEAVAAYAAAQSEQEALLASRKQRLEALWRELEAAGKEAGSYLAASTALTAWWEQGGTPQGAAQAVARELAAPLVPNAGLQQRAAALREQLKANHWLPAWLACHTHGPFASHLSDQPQPVPVESVLQRLRAAASALSALHLPDDFLADEAILAACCQPGDEPDWQVLAAAVHAKVPKAAAPPATQAGQPHPTVPPAPAPQRRGDGACRECSEAAKKCMFCKCTNCCPGGKCSRHPGEGSGWEQLVQKDAARERLRRLALRISGPLRRAALATALSAEGLAAEQVEQDVSAQAYARIDCEGWPWSSYDPLRVTERLVASAAARARRALVRQALARAQLPLDLSGHERLGAFKDLIKGKKGRSMAGVEARVVHLVAARGALVAAKVAWHARLGGPELTSARYLRRSTLARTHAAAERMAASACMHCQSAQAEWGGSGTCNTCADAHAPKDAVAAAAAAAVGRQV